MFRKIKKPLLLVHGWQTFGMPAWYGGSIWNNFIEFYNNDVTNEYGTDLKELYNIYQVEYLY